MSSLEKNITFLDAAFSSNLVKSTLVEEGARLDLLAENVALLAGDTRKAVIGSANNMKLGQQATDLVGELDKGLS